MRVSPIKPGFPPVVRLAARQWRTAPLRQLTVSRVPLGTQLTDWRRWGVKPGTVEPPIGRPTVGRKRSFVRATVRPGVPQGASKE
jgi:hypothetical protein